MATRSARVAGCHERHTGGDALVASVAARQHGLVTTAQLAAAGIGRRGIDHRVATGRLTRRCRGVYLVGPLEATYTAEMAALLACGVQRSALGHETAAALLGFRPRPETVEVIVAANVRPRAGLRIRRTVHLDPADVTTRHGLRVTTPARTLLDLATQLAPHDLERAVNEALIRKLTTTREITLLTRRSSALEAALAGEPALTRSEAEARLLALIRAARLPPPGTNTRVSRYEVDFFWRSERLIVEVDGFAFHSSRAAFERDRARDADLQAAGYRVIRVTWRQLTQEAEAVVARIAGALAVVATA